MRHRQSNVFCACSGHGRNRCKGEVLLRQGHFIGSDRGKEMRSKERMKQLDQVVFERKVGCRVARGNVQFTRAQVRIDGTRTDDQGVSHLRIGQSLCH
jgi:hypothetical protein